MKFTKVEHFQPDITHHKDQAVRKSTIRLPDRNHVPGT